MSFRPYQPRARLSESLSAADVHLVSLRTELEGFIVPSKFYGVSAAGRPTIFIGDKDGEIARVITAANCGVAVGEGDGEALARAVLALGQDPERCAAMGMRARNLCVENFDKSVAARKWLDLLSELGGSKAGVVTRVAAG